MKIGESRANANKRIRRDALREQIKSQRHEQEAVVLINKIKNLEDDLDANSVNRLRIALDGHMKLLTKYLPDTKAVEMTFDESGTNTREDHAKALGELLDFPTGRATASS